MSDSPPTAAVSVLRSLRRNGVEYLFANLGTDHTPILEAYAELRERGAGDDAPELVVCPHEFVAMSAAHGYAAATGDPQAVLVHVDVGTQNLGAAMHNAHRCDAPVFVLAGTAPVTDSAHPGARDNSVHTLQDTFDQHGIVREYCRWTGRLEPPGHPEPLVARGLERARAPPGGPVYLTASREALETRPETGAGERSRKAAGPTMPRISEGDADALAAAVSAAEAPLLLTSKLGVRDGGLDAAQAFAEQAGAGVVESRPLGLAMPRDHDLHVGFDASEAVERADLVLAADIDVPWTTRADAPEDAETVLLDPTPSKPTFPQWDFAFDRRVAADPVDALAAVAERLDRSDGEASRKTWRAVATARRERVRGRLAEERERDALTPGVVADIVNDALPSDAVVLEDAVTSRSAVLDHLDRREPGSYFSNAGTGLGWAGGAAVGVKLATGESPVVSLVGDGAYLFGHPSASAWLAAATEAPTLTVILDNQGWNAVRRATVRQHPDGAVASEGVPGSGFEPGVDLSAPAGVVDSFTRVARDEASLRSGLDEALSALVEGRPAVIDAKIEPV